MPTVITTVELEARLGGLAAPIGPRDFDAIWPGVAQMAVSDVRRNFQRSAGPDGRPWVPLAHGRPGSPAGAKPLRDRGLLMASISGKADGPGIKVGTNLEYAAIHQYGGTIVPRRAKFLAIPLTREARRAGSPRRFPGTFRFVPTRTGGWVMLAARPGRRGSRAAAVPVAQYLLVASVTIPARPFLGFSRDFLDRVGRLLEDRAVQVISERIEKGIWKRI